MLPCGAGEAVCLVVEGVGFASFAGATILMSRVFSRHARDTVKK
jgi:hypothetical protein